MWLSKRNTELPAGEATAEDGVVTLEGERLAVYAQGERRGLPVYGPGGLCWRPAVGDQVLVLKLGQEGEQCCVAGARQAMPEGLQPGELLFRAGGGAEIWLKNDGTVELTGDVRINGEPYRPCQCAPVTGDEEKKEGEGES